MERTYITPLLDKLGVRPGARVALIRIDDPTIRELIAERTLDVTDSWPELDTDIVLLGVDSPAELADLATLRDVEVIAAAKGAGLIDNKVASFSATHTALRLVIPVALRSR